MYNTYRQLDPDIIMLNSHGVKAGEELKLYTYNVYKSNYSNEANDGVAIAVKNTLPHKLLDDFEHCLAVEIETSRGPVILATCYLPFRREIFPFPELHRLSVTRTPTFLIGDLNARHRVLGHNGANNNNGRNLARVMRDRNLRHYGPDFPTFIREDCATAPDIMMGNEASHIFNVHLDPGPLTTADHLPIVATISTNPIMIEPVIMRDQYHRADWEGMQQHLQSLPVTTNLRNATINEIEEEVEKWYTDLQNARDRFIPKVRYRRLPCPVPTQEIEHLQSMFSDVKNLASVRGWTLELKNRYRQLRNELREKWIQESNRHWEALVSRTESHYDDPAKFWKDIKRLSGKTYAQDTYLFNERREKMWTAPEKEAVHRRYYKDIFRITEEENTAFDANFEREVIGELSNHEDLLHPSPTADFTKLDFDNPLTRRITPREIKQTIKSFKSGKSPGESGISKAILEKLPNKMIGRLCNIFNACLAAGYFPKRFKRAILALIPKPGKSPHEVTGKRPISLLECPAKVLEKIINKRLRNFLMDHDLNNSRQHGFRPGRGTHTAISAVYETISIAKMDKLRTNLVLRDVSKAFDKVWHEGLKLKLIRLGLPDCVTRFLCSFLEGRTARIRLGNHLGEIIRLESGVPQGSCLSPTLYIIYTADLPPPQGSSEYVAYADDITQIVTWGGTNPRPTEVRLARKTEEAIQSINDFENKWKIATNQSKFTVVPIGQFINEPIVVNGRRIVHSNYGTVLGLRIGKRGIAPHTRLRVKQAKAQLTRIKRFGTLPERLKSHLYKALIRPILEYPPVPLDTVSKSQQLSLQRVQNQAVRWIANWVPPYTETQEEAHMRLGLEPLNVRIHRMSRKVWQRVEAYDEEVYQRLVTAEPISTSKWFPRSLPLVEPPEELYIQRNRADDADPLDPDDPDVN